MLWACFVSHRLNILIPLPGKNQFETHIKGFRMCRYYWWEYISFCEGGQFRLDCLLPFVLVQALLALSHGFRIWIILKVVGNWCHEICIYNCSHSIIWFSRINIISANSLYPFWLFTIFQYNTVKVFQCLIIRIWVHCWCGSRIWVHNWCGRWI